MSSRRVFYIFVGSVLLGVFLMGWGALIASTWLTLLGVILCTISGAFRLWWWAKVASDT